MPHAWLPRPATRLLPPAAARKQCASAATQLPPLPRGAFLALGKFDALHLGHRALAAAAAQAAPPAAPLLLLSFEGIASVLGWEPRSPLVASCDRPRVLAAWSSELLSARPGGALGECSLPFAAIRSLSPAAFVALLRQLGAGGVVAGANYRFGYRASGDAAALRALCEEAGLGVAVVPLLHQHPGAPQVSSTAVRAALEAGDCAAAAALLGRPHRCVLRCPAPAAAWAGGVLELPVHSAANQLPAAGRGQAGRALVELLEADGRVLWSRDGVECELLPGAQGAARLALPLGLGLGEALVGAPAETLLRCAVDV